MTLDPIPEKGQIWVQRINAELVTVLRRGLDLDPSNGPKQYYVCVETSDGTQCLYKDYLFRQDFTLKYLAHVAPSVKLAPGQIWVQRGDPLVRLEIKQVLPTVRVKLLDLFDEEISLPEKYIRTVYTLHKA